MSMELDEQLRNKYGLSYHISYALEAERRVGLRGKRVLEIGGSLPRDFVLGDLGAARWVAIEELSYYREIKDKKSGSESGVLSSAARDDDITTVDAVKNIDNLGDYSVVFGRVEGISEAFFNQFDVAFSIAAFEHIDRFPAALARMYDALAPGGKLFTMFSPIWSGFNGHHLHGVTDKNGKVYDAGNVPIPPWGHLLMRPPELYQHLLSHMDADTAAEIVYHVYNSPSINRLFTEDYYDYFRLSPFTVDTFLATFPVTVPDEALALLRERCPKYANFANAGILAVLTKP